MNGVRGSAIRRRSLAADKAARGGASSGRTCPVPPVQLIGHEVLAARARLERIARVARLRGVLKTDDEIANLTEDEWTTIYEKLYGGFEDLDDLQSDDDDELLTEDEDEPGVKRTKTGYVKDGFIIDDDDSDDVDDDDDASGDDVASDEPSDEEAVRKSKVKSRKATNVKKPAPKRNVKKAFETTKNGKGNEIDVEVEDVGDVEEDLYLDCTSELCEEEYV